MIEEIELTEETRLHFYLGREKKENPDVLGKGCLIVHSNFQSDVLQMRMVESSDWVKGKVVLVRIDMVKSGWSLIYFFLALNIKILWNSNEGGKKINQTFDASARHTWLASSKPEGSIASPFTKWLSNVLSLSKSQVEKTKRVRWLVMSKYILNLITQQHRCHIFILDSTWTYKLKHENDPFTECHTTPDKYISI